MANLERDRFNLLNWKAMLPFHREGFDSVYYGVGEARTVEIRIPRTVWEEMDKPKEIEITVRKREFV